MRLTTEGEVFSKSILSIVDQLFRTTFDPRLAEL
jgi:hypothetical protein